MDTVDFTGALISRYRFRKCLGKGGYAAVYLADELGPDYSENKRSVAIKIFCDDIKDRASFQSTFQNFLVDYSFLVELSADSPVVQYYTWEIVDIFLSPEGYVFTIGQRDSLKENNYSSITAFMLVMEYADGGSLGEEYRQEVILKGDSSYLDHFLDVCVAIRNAHDKEIVHRDIKPENLFYFKKLNKVKVGDFGIAKYINAVHPAGFYFKGSLHYSSPESFNPSVQPATPRDIYALGCTFFRLLTGNVPFDIPNQKVNQMADLELVEAFRSLHSTAQRPDALTSTTGHVPIVLNNLLKEMMAIAPENRPNIHRVIEILRAYKDSVSLNTSSSLTGNVVASSSKKPIALSKYNIQPNFRREILKQSVFFIFVNFDFRSREKRLFTDLCG